MDIQSLGLLSSIAAQGNTIVDNSIKCKDEFEKLLQQINEDTDIAEMKKFLDEKYNVTLDVGSIGNCYDFLNNHDIRCTNYVRISPQTLQNMDNSVPGRSKFKSCFKKQSAKRHKGFLQ